MSTCTRCGESNSLSARFCQACGSRLDENVNGERRRRTVTVLFADLVGSTALGESLDAETLRDVLDRYFRAMRIEIERHGGAVEKYIGDAVMAVFGIATLHEDDALRAVRAGWQMLEALTSLNIALDREFGVSLENRIGINTGEAIVGDPSVEQRMVTGDAVNVAARLEQAAAPGEILLGPTTLAIVQSFIEAEALQPLTVKGKSERVRAHRLLRLLPEVVSRPMREESAIVGREDQIARLVAALSDVVSSSRARLALVRGEAGIGKSRLAAEFVDRASSRALVLTGRCLSYGEGITFWPVAQIVRTAVGVSDREHGSALRERLARVDPDERTVGPLAALLEGSLAYPVEETMRAVRRLMEAVTRSGPVIVLVEDIHWAEPTMLELLAQLASTRAQALVVCTARPEFDEAELMGSADLTLELESLHETDAAELLDGLAGDMALHARLRAQILEAAGGNPLFLEQMVAMLSDGQALPSATAAGARVDVPPSVSALLDARIDQIPSAMRSILERAAVIGRIFYTSGLAALSAGTPNGQLDDALTELVNKGFIRRSISDLEGEEAFSFSHALIADAAYRGSLKRTRADLHERFAEWIEQRPLDGPGAIEILGSHLERAHGLLRELGVAGPGADQLAERAGDVLATAGRRAAARGDVGAASSLLARAVSLLPDGRQRIMLQLETGEQLLESGRLDDAEVAVADALSWSLQQDSVDLHARARITDLTLQLYRSRLNMDEARSQVERLREVLDEPGLARAEMLIGIVEFSEGGVARSEIAFLRAAELGEVTGDQALLERALDWVPLATAVGPTPVPQALARCQAVLDEARPGSRVQASACYSIAFLESLLGHVDRARTLVLSARATYEELGMQLEAATSSQATAGIELRCGDPSRVVEELEADHELLAGLGERAYLATTTLRIAQVHYALGDLDRADAAAGETVDLFGDLDDSAMLPLLGVRARILARRGRFDEAEALGLRMLEGSSRNDRHDDVLSALTDLSEVVILAGHPDHAVPLLLRAQAHCTSKGDLAGLVRVEQLRALV